MRPFSHFRGPLQALSTIDKSRPSKITKDLMVRKERVARAARMAAKKEKAEEHGYLKEARLEANGEKAKEKEQRTAGSFQTSSKATGQLPEGCQLAKQGQWCDRGLHGCMKCGSPEHSFPNCTK